MKALVHTPFKGVKDGEIYPRDFAAGDPVHGDLARVAIKENWAHPAEEEREDGPTLSEWVKAGYPEAAYPPKGYADKRTSKELARANLRLAGGALVEIASTLPGAAEVLAANLAAQEAARKKIAKAISARGAKAR
jgi:hypothetical protein